MFIGIYVYMYKILYVYMYTCIYACMYVYVYVFICIFVYMYICKYVCICTCIHVYTNIGHEINLGIDVVVCFIHLLVSHGKTTNFRVWGLKGSGWVEV